MTSEPLPVDARYCQPMPANDNVGIGRREESEEGSADSHGSGNRPSPMAGTARPASRRDAVLSFGQHKGKYIRELETPYLRWVVEKATIVPPHEREAVAQELIARGAPVPPVRARDGQNPAKGTSGQTEPAVGNTNAAAAPNTSYLLSVEDLAKLLNVSKRTVWRMRDDGRLPPPLQLGKQILRWEPDKIKEWIITGRIGLPRVEADPRRPPTDDNG
jgi:prophage regulatory protein